MKDFQPFTTKHHLPNALLLAKASELAYRDEPAVAQTLGEWGLHLHQCFSAGGTQAIAGFDDRVVIIAFRGTQTNEIEDIVADVRVQLVPDLIEGRVHSGFRDALDTVWTEVDAATRALVTHERTLWVTGHSLGGALGTLAASRWIRQARPINGIYTFGAPRVGNYAFATAYDLRAKSKTFRYVNDRDIVPRLPPREVPMPQPHEPLEYRHVGRSRFFDSQGRLRDDPSAWNQFLASFTIPDSLEALKAAAKERVDDHGMHHYVALLEAVIENPDLREDGEGDSLLESIWKSFGSLFG